MSKKNKRLRLSPFVLGIYELVAKGYTREEIHDLIDIVVTAALPEPADAAGGGNFVAVQRLHRRQTEEDSPAVYPWPSGEDPA